MKRDHRDFVEDMHQAISDGDRKTVNAVVRSLEVLGEAARSIPETVRQKYPEIPWKNIIGMRHRVVHGYIHVDYDLVWDAVTLDVQPLFVQLERIVPPDTPRDDSLPGT